jgi:hypothetical protein
MTMGGNNPRFNASGCPDPTAYEALQPIIKEDAELEKKAHDLIKILKVIMGLAGFELMNRIEIKDKKSGRVFK